jgi:Heterokaryon incompatibility protein (HET)
VACIDQREESVDQGREIGKQAAIFQQAKKVFAWLSHLKSEELQRYVDNISEIKSAVDHPGYQMAASERRQLLKGARKSLRCLFADGMTRGAQTDA